MRWMRGMAGEWDKRDGLGGDEGDGWGGVTDWTHSY